MPAGNEFHWLCAVQSLTTFASCLCFQVPVISSPRLSRTLITAMLAAVLPRGPMLFHRLHHSNYRNQETDRASVVLAKLGCNCQHCPPNTAHSDRPHHPLLCFCLGPGLAALRFSAVTIALSSADWLGTPATSHQRSQTCARNFARSDLKACKMHEVMCASPAALAAASAALLWTASRCAGMPPFCLRAPLAVLFCLATSAASLAGPSAWRKARVGRVQCKVRVG